MSAVGRAPEPCRFGGARLSGVIAGLATMVLAEAGVAARDTPAVRPEPARVDLGGEVRSGPCVPCSVAARWRQRLERRPDSQSPPLSEHNHTLNLSRQGSAALSQGADTGGWQDLDLSALRSMPSTTNLTAIRSIRQPLNPCCGVRLRSQGSLRQRRTRTPAMGSLCPSACAALFCRDHEGPHGKRSGAAAGKSAAL
jgi:hypothetical protein